MAIKNTKKSSKTSNLNNTEFSSAFKYASIGMAIVDTNGAWLKVNKSLCNFLGYSEEELLNTTFQDITHKDDLENDLKYVNQILHGKINTYQMEKRYYTKSGKLVWALLSVSLVWEESKPKYFISQIQDITERKFLEIKLNEEKLRLNQILKGTNVGTWEWNVQTGEVFFNERWADIIGFTLEELAPISIETWIEKAHPDDLLISNQKLQDCFDKKEEFYDCTCRMKHKSGKWIWVMDRGKVMSWTDDGKPLWMFGSHTEITEIKLLEESLKLEREKFYSIFNSAHQLMAFLDADGTILECNEAFLNKSFEYKAGTLLWNSSMFEITKKTSNDIKTAFENTLTGKNINYEAVVWDENKTPITILINLKPIYNRFEKVVNVIFEGIIIQKLIDYRKEIESKNRELENFATIAAHDLKQPLQTISQFLALLSKKHSESLDEKAKQYINFTLNDAKKMTQLINELLDYAKIGGLESQKFEMVDLNLIFKEVKLLYKSSIKIKNAKIKISKNLPIIAGSKVALQILFQNIIGNALKYQQPDSLVKIEVDYLEKETEDIILIKDNGIGISEQHIPKIFSPFKRLHSASKYEGIGLGLFACKKIVDLHNGSISVYSKIEVGTTIEIKFPKIV